MKNFLYVIVVSLFFIACSSATDTDSDMFLVDWEGGSWHLAKLVEQCDEGKGWIVDFKSDFFDPEDNSEFFDGDQFFNEKPVCYPLNSVIENNSPGSGEVEIGEVVVVKFQEDDFYTAKILSIEDDQYEVEFMSIGWEPSKFSLDEIRVLK